MNPDDITASTIVVVRYLDSDEAGDYRLARYGDVVDDPDWKITDIDPADLD